MLHLQHLTKKFRETTAVSDVSFDIQEGQIFALIGPNGSGKTTLIKMIAGLLQPTAGSISVDAFNVVNDPLKAKAVIGYIPDEPAIWPSMTGEEFLHFSGALYGIDEKTRKERIAQLLSRFSLEGIEHGYFEDYSRGNKQKYVIVAAMLHQPKILLIDEPIVGLDPVSAEVAESMFTDFTKRGGSILLVTHTLPVAERIANRIGILERGKLIAEGTINELRNKAKVDPKAPLDAIYKALT